MKEPHGEGVAIHTDPESCGVGRKALFEALTGAHVGQPLSREITERSGRRRHVRGGRRNRVSRHSEGHVGPARSETLNMHGNTLRENRETLRLPYEEAQWAASGSRKRNPMMYERRESDRPTVPTKRSNNAGGPVAEIVEGDGLAKGNLGKQSTSQAQNWQGVHDARTRIREGNLLVTTQGRSPVR